MGACRSSCPSQDHNSWGECARSANFHVAYAAEHKGADYTKQKRWDADLASYKEARDAGLEPASTQIKDVRAVTEPTFRSETRIEREVSQLQTSILAGN